MRACRAYWSPSGSWSPSSQSGKSARSRKYRVLDTVSDFAQIKTHTGYAEHSLQTFRPFSREYPDDLGNQR